MTDAARVFEVLAGEDIGYLGGAPRGRFASVHPAPAGTVQTNGDESQERRVTSREEVEVIARDSPGAARAGAVAGGHRSAVEVDHNTADRTDNDVQ
jgi:hypothetical protein